jgi:predicted amidohydrolase YtcJ
MDIAMKSVFLLSALMLYAGCGAAAVGVLHNANIRTLDPANPTADALAWKADGTIVAIGNSEALLREHPQAERIDAGGRVVIPGLIDAHAHLINLGHALMNADLSGADSKDEIVRRLQAFAAELPPGAWLLGRGWDQNRWPEQEFPTAADLDIAFPARPVWLARVDGHAGWANSAALAQATRDLSGTWQPDGGRIFRDADGRPTGVLIDTAMEFVAAAMPAATAATREVALRRALDEAVRQGLTGVHDMGVSLADLALFRRLADANALPLRVTAYADGDSQALTALCAFGALTHPSGRLSMGGVKLYADGALGSRGAVLIEDYHDEPGHRGLAVTSEADLDSAMRKARDCGLQVATHAIGDGGNRMVLSLYERVLGDRARGDHRWRIEHAQIVDPADIPRFAALKVLASMQPIHATSDMPWVPARLGQERLDGAYAWRSFLEHGVRMPFGSDFPVEPVNPLFGLYAAVTRQDEAGNPPGGWLPGQRLTLVEALHGFTAEAAFAGFAEDEVGRLTPGRRADFVVLGVDPFAVGADRLRRLDVESTWVDGRAVYTRPGDSSAR